MNDNDSDRTKSVAQMVRETIHMRPSLLDALKMQIVNYSALARMLQTEIGEGSLEAVKAAIIRVSDELETENSLREEMVLSILRESVVRLQDKISVIISSEELDIPYIVTAYLTDSYVYVVDQTRLKNKLPDHVQVSSNLVALILITRLRGVHNVSSGEQGDQHRRVHKLLNEHGHNPGSGGRPERILPPPELHLGPQHTKPFKSKRFTTKKEFKE